MGLVALSYVSAWGTVKPGADVISSNSDPSRRPAPREAEAPSPAAVRAPRCADDLVLRRPRGPTSRSRLRGCVAAASSSLNVECRFLCIVWVVELPCPGWLLCGWLLSDGRATSLVLLTGVVITVVVAMIATTASPPAPPPTVIVTPLAGRRYGPRRGLARR